MYNMSDVAELAGVRAKETDVVTVEFTKDEVKEYLHPLAEGSLALFDYKRKTSNEWAMSLSRLRDKLKKANPDWEF